MLHHHTKQAEQGLFKSRLYAYLNKVLLGKVSMTHESREKIVDIFRFPKDIEACEGKQITIGALHANSMKLIFMLIKHGIATGINERDYQKLVHLYRENVASIDNKDLDDFNNILNNMQFSRHTAIRLIGGELYASGKNDYFTIKILNKLHEEKVPVEMLMSNNSFMFLDIRKFDDNILYPISSNASNEHVQSIINLKNFIDRKLISPDEVINFQRNCYIPNLRILSYNLQPGTNDASDTIDIFSNALIGLDEIKSLAQSLEVEYNDTTAVNLAITIDNINNRVQQYIINDSNKFNSLFHKEYSGFKLQLSPAEAIINNEELQGLTIPSEHNDYRLRFIRGSGSPSFHDMQQRREFASLTHIVNLHNRLGGFGQVSLFDRNKMGHYSRGEYLVHHNDRNEFVKFWMLLDALNSKKMQEENSSYSNIANKLRNSLKESYDILLSEPNTNNLAVFKKNCEDAISTAQKDLKRRTIIVNVQSFFSGLMIFYLIACCINYLTGKSFFFTPTPTLLATIDTLSKEAQNLTYALTTEDIAEIEEIEEIEETVTYAQTNTAINNQTNDIEYEVSNEVIDYATENNAINDAIVNNDESDTATDTVTIHAADDNRHDAGFEVITSTHSTETGNDSTYVTTIEDEQEESQSQSQANSTWQNLAMNLNLTVIGLGIVSFISYLIRYTLTDNLFTSTINCPTQQHTPHIEHTDIKIDKASEITEEDNAASSYRM